MTFVDDVGNRCGFAMPEVVKAKQMAPDVRWFHDVVINERDAADTRLCKLLDDRAAKGSRTKHDYALGLPSGHLRKLVTSNCPVWVNSLDQHWLDSLARPST